MKIYNDLFSRITSMENLVTAWEEFKKDKSQKPDVQTFEFALEQNLFQLQRELELKQYQHGPYTSFYIRDPKVRHIHKAAVRDRVLHHAVFRILDPIFESTFISNSFSCRIGKGTHKGVLVVKAMMCQESKNYTVPCFVLKCDVRKFFDTIDHETLLEIFKKRIIDPDARWLSEQIIGSFSAGWTNLFNRHGLPIGNLTSQLFANVYLNEFDQFIKHQIKVKHYARYTDDFVIISTDRMYLEGLLNPIKEFLHNRLKLTLHPKKISIRKYRQGADYLGQVILPHHLVLRSKTKRRIFRKLRRQVRECREGKRNETTLLQSLQSYLGVLSHVSAYRLSEKLKNKFWFWLNE